MPDLNGPLFSINASGTLAKTITYSRWKGIKYARQRVIPTNPKTAKQLDVRQVFTNLSAYWTWASSGVQEPWNLMAKGQPFTNRNALVMVNSNALYRAALTSAFIASKGTPPLPNKTPITVTAGVTQLTIAATAPSLPSGFTFVGWRVVVFPSVDPTQHPINLLDAHYATAGAGNLSEVMTGLTTGRLYDVFVWYTATDPLGNDQVNPSAEGTGTPT